MGSRRSLGIVLFALVASVVTVSSASAVELLATGTIDVDTSNMSACASATFGQEQLFITGEFTAVGIFASPKASDGPKPDGVVLGATPIVLKNSSRWNGCLSGTNLPVGANGVVVYTLQASGSNAGDVFIARVCTATLGTVSCFGA